MIAENEHTLDGPMTDVNWTTPEWREVDVTPNRGTAGERGSALTGAIEKVTVPTVLRCRPARADGLVGNVSPASGHEPRLTAVLAGWRPDPAGSGCAGD